MKPMISVFSKHLISLTCAYLSEIKKQLCFAKHLLFIVYLSVCLSKCPSKSFQNYLSRTTGPISSKLHTEHPWVKGIKFLSNEGPCPFSKGRLKQQIEILKIFSRTAGPISTKQDTNYSWLNGIQICSI